MAIKRRTAQTADDTTTAPAPAPQPAVTPKAATGVTMLPLGAYTGARRTVSAGDVIYGDIVPATPRTGWPTLPVA